MENNIRVYRERLGLSQEAVSREFRAKYGRSTITARHISKWERREVVPSVENALILARILQCKVEDLFDLD